ncbi:MAG: EAL domain-containing protein [Steroidobacteraceae bacterium]
MLDVSENSAVPMVILARQQEQVEFINRTLRQAGHAVHCHWVSELSDLSETLNQVNAYMVMAIVGPEAGETAAALQAFRQFAPKIPALIVREQLDETLIAQAMLQGANDVVTLGHPQRLQAVVTRELASFRLAHKLAATIGAAHEYREQLKHLMSGSADAIAHVQEGILVDPNPAWLTLLGHTTAETMNGQPLMDFFDADSHAALKGALVACLQGKWANHGLKVHALQTNGATLPLELHLQAVELEGDPAVQLKVAAQKTDTRDLDEQMHDALARDASTGLLQRRFFIERLQTILQQPLRGGVRELVCIQPDKFAALCDELGQLHLEDFVAQFASLIKEHLQPHDLSGRFGDCQMFILLERGTHDDVQAWCASVTRKIAAHVFAIADKSLHCTCTIGIGLIAPHGAHLDVVIKDALQGLQQAQQQGGNRTETVDHVEDDTRQQANDKIWVRLIKSALMENRFRLLQQPIVAMSGEDKGMHDVLVRMLDEQGQEVIPTEFLAAAERNDLMKNIDRWIIGAAISFCASRKVQKLFVRLSKDSVLDRSLPIWLENQLKATRIDPARIVFEISEQVATGYLNNARELTTLLHKTGFKFALEHAGKARDPVQLMHSLPLDYVKIDGALMQGLAVDMMVQEQLRTLVDAAKAKQISTIAERVEDANTMAVLWQLGFEYIQGYFINQPEQVTLG